ncbi:MAG: phosphoglycolate phosphatase [Sphingomonadales bacterium]|nr:phosphoglycolate phosphatase [Sphingomonadales bacterium]
MNRLAIFDCDGTLVDSQANICLAMEECFVGAGLQAPPRERIRRVVGLSLVEAMRAMLPEAGPDRHAALAEDYKIVFQALRGRGLVEEPLYDGIADLLDTLEAGGWRLAIATGKSDRGLALCLDRHGLSRRFVSLQTADRHPSKPHPSMVAQALAEAEAAPERSMMIGDTSYDMAMAKAAGVRAIGVAWGYHDEQELLAAGADYVAAHPSEIAELVRAFA